MAAAAEELLKINQCHHNIHQRVRMLHALNFYVKFQIKSNFLISFLFFKMLLIRDFHIFCVEKQLFKPIDSSKQIFKTFHFYVEQKLYLAIIHFNEHVCFRDILSTNKDIIKAIFIVVSSLAESFQTFRFMYMYEKILFVPGILSFCIFFYPSTLILY